MTQAHIRNVIFDIGNVIVRWDPVHIITQCFGAARATPEIVGAVFGPDIWHPLNRGTLTGAEARAAYCAALGLSALEADTLFAEINASLTPVEGTRALMDRLAAAGYRLFALSDNVHELVTHLKTTQDFWPLFEGAIISAEVGLLKPDPAIYETLLQTFDLNAGECVFLDDVPANVAGAQSAGLHAFQFATSARADADLQALGLTF